MHTQQFFYFLLHMIEFVVFGFIDIERHICR